MTWQPGEELQNGKYKIKKELGRGRFAITYLAESQGQDVVIKTLNPDLLQQLSDKECNNLQSGFADESRKLEKCQHPHIVRVIETFMHGRLQCTVMEYIAGATLASLVQRVLPEKEALKYIQQIGQALTVVHQQGFLHRDVKPENIMVRKGRTEAVLIDFDSARGFDHPLTSRSPREEGFTPPELYSNSPRQQARRGAWTDIYSLAATLYILLTGEQPTSAIDRKDQNKRLIPPKELNQEVSHRVNQAILHAMEVDTDKRPETVTAWLTELGVRDSLTLPNWLKIQPLWTWLLGVVSILVLFGSLISIANDTLDLREKIFPNQPQTQEAPPPPTPTPKN